MDECEPADNLDVTAFTECGESARTHKVPMQKYLYMGSALLLRFNVLSYVCRLNSGFISNNPRNANNYYLSEKQVIQKLIEIAGGEEWARKWLI